MASLPHISVAVACATSTHDSENSLLNLSSTDRAMEIVIANGEVMTFFRKKNTEEFFGAVVHLGLIEVLTKLILKVQVSVKKS